MATAMSLGEAKSRAIVARISPGWRSELEMQEAVGQAARVSEHDRALAQFWFAQLRGSGLIEGRWIADGKREWRVNPDPPQPLDPGAAFKAETARRAREEREAREREEALRVENQRRLDEPFRQLQARAIDELVNASLDRLLDARVDARLRELGLLTDEDTRAAEAVEAAA